jgi:type II secretory pathway component PulJ
MNLFLKLMIALILSAVLSFALLRRWRDEVAEQLSASSRRRVEQKEKLRTALAGEDEANPADADRR